MKRTNIDSALLAIVVLLFSVSVGILHGIKKNKPDQLPVIFVHPFDSMVSQKAYESMRHLMISKSIAALVDILRGCSLEKMLEIVPMLTNESVRDLSRDEKINFLYGVALSQVTDADRFQILYTIKKDPYLYNGPQSLLTVAANGTYSGIIPTLLRWLKVQNQLDQSVSRAYRDAVQKNSLATVQVLLFKGVPLKQSLATELLAFVVTQNKKSEFVPIFTAKGADTNYHTDKHTLLMTAVINNNKQMVLALLKVGLGSTMQTIIDPAVGTALQLAIQKGYSEIDQLLRQYGAQEL